MSIKNKIEQKIIDFLAPEFIEVINESIKHQGHAGDNGTGESHFKLKVISSAFKGMPSIKRQRLVYSILSDEMKFIHALSLDLKEKK